MGLPYSAQQPLALLLTEAMKQPRQQQLVALERGE